jgi:hypothetical protein
MADTQRRSRPLKPTLRLQAGVSIRLALSKQSVIARMAHPCRLKKVSDGIALFFCIKGGQRSKLIFGMVNLRKNNGFKFEKNRLKAMFQTA